MSLERQFTFNNPVAGDVVVTLRERRRAVRLPAVKQDAYNAEIHVPPGMSKGPASFQLPITMTVHKRPE